MKWSRAESFVALVTAAFVIPGILPPLQLDFTYFFILVIVLMAWFAIKWSSVKAIGAKSTLPEIILGLAVILAVYSYNVFSAKEIGILDLLFIFLAAVVATYGVRSLVKFWVPAAYVLVLLAGYQIENYTPNYQALQNWLAAVLTSSVNLLGIQATVNGEYVTMVTKFGPIILDIASDCTGLQGILAFGMLSTMTLLDFKPRMSRIVPIFAIGFLGAFLVNIARLLVVFLTFNAFGIDAGVQVHVYFGYLLFIGWVLAFWAIAFKYLLPVRGAIPPQASIPVGVGRQKGMS